MRLWLLLLLMVLFIARCSSDEDLYRITVEQRQALAPSAAAMLADIPRAVAEHDFARALALCDSLERVAPALADVPYERGRIYTRMGHLAEAQTAFEKVLTLDPRYPGVWFELGNLAFRKQQYQEAAACFQKEEDLLLELREARPEGVVLSPRGLPSARLQRARAAKQLGDVQLATDTFERILEEDSTFSEAYYELSRLREEDGDLEGALAYARRAYHLGPENPDYTYLLGSLLYQAGNPQEALPYLEKVIARRPWYAEGLYNLGQVLVRIGREQEAQSYLREAERMRQVQAQIDQVRVTAALYPRVVSHWLNLAELYMAAARYAEAEQAFVTALQLDPENLMIHNDLGNLYALEGDYASAVRAFRAILAQDSTHADVWLNLGAAYALSGDLKAARHAWERTLAHAPGHPEAEANLARLAQLNASAARPFKP